MICANCGQDNAAVYTKSTGGKEITIRLCPACHKKLYTEQAGGDFFASFAEGWDGKKACPTCGTTLRDFRASGLLGCAFCYTAFRAELLPAVRYAQGKVYHEGSAPNHRADEKYDETRRLVYEKEELESRLRFAERFGDESDIQRVKEKLDIVNRSLYGGED